jgi:hypothetical protein
MAEPHRTRPDYRLADFIATGYKPSEAAAIVCLDEQTVLDQLDTAEFRELAYLAHDDIAAASMTSFEDFRRRQVRTSGPTPKEVIENLIAVKSDGGSLASRSASEIGRNFRQAVELRKWLRSFESRQAEGDN